MGGPKKISPLMKICALVKMQLYGNFQFSILNNKQFFFGRVPLIPLVNTTGSFKHHRVPQICQAPQTPQYFQFTHIFWENRYFSTENQISMLMDLLKIIF